MAIVKRLATANHTHTWWYNMSPLKFCLYPYIHYVSDRVPTSLTLTRGACLRCPGEGGQHGQCLPAPETRPAAAALGGRGPAAGGPAGPLSRGQDQQRHQQHGLRYQQGTSTSSSSSSRRRSSSSLFIVIHSYTTVYKNEMAFLTVQGANTQEKTF